VLLEFLTKVALAGQSAGYVFKTQLLKITRSPFPMKIGNSEGLEMSAIVRSTTIPKTAGCRVDRINPQ
jgi:hypothetical protein